MTTMKAVVCKAYGGPGVLSVQQVAKPRPAAGQVLIEVMAAGISTADAMMRSGEPKFGRLFLGIKRPKQAVMGTGFSGVITELGQGVTDFDVGDEVFGESIFAAGSQCEFLAIEVDKLLLLKPRELSHQQAAVMCDGVLTSLSFLRDVASLQAEQRILINGAAGSLGSAATQIAKAKGAKVAAVASAESHALLKSLGAEQVVDYRQADFLTHLPSGSFDVIYDAVGKLKFNHCKHLLHKNGEYLTPVLSSEVLAWSLYSKVFSNLFTLPKVKFSATGMRAVEQLKPLLQEIINMVKKAELSPLVSREFAFAEIQEAHAIIDQGHKKGSFVLLPKS